VAAARDSTPEFERVLEKIRADEGEVWVRELGFGLNRALGRERMIRDIGTLERMCGVHLSLGAKHAVYKNRKQSAFRHRAGGAAGGVPDPSIGVPGRTNPVVARHHVDVFLAVERVFIDDEAVFRNGAWTVR
jgi:hypothetical protein